MVGGFDIVVLVNQCTPFASIAPPRSRMIVKETVSTNLKISPWLDAVFVDIVMISPSKQRCCASYDLTKSRKVRDVSRIIANFIPTQRLINP
jgi:hypothetical protein